MSFPMRSFLSLAPSCCGACEFRDPVAHFALRGPRSLYTTSMTKRSFVWLIVFLALPFVVGAIGSFATMPSIPTWYQGLTKPPINPPNWIFGPVWTTLYLFMGYASYRIFKKEVRSPKLKKEALTVYAVHLLLNGLWSVAFFGLQSPLYGLLVIIPLLLLVMWTMFLFRRLDTIAGVLFIPYVLWVSFATYLNVTIFVLN